MPTIDIRLPQFHPSQAKVHPLFKRYTVLACGRQWGKSTLAKYELSVRSLNGQHCAYMAPTTKMLDQMWREMKALLAPAIFEKNEQDHRITLLGGGFIEFWSLDNPDGPRGRRYDYIVIDEAAFVRSVYAWENVVSPTLIAKQGSALFVSTPRGFTWFYDLFMLGVGGTDPEWVSFTLPTSDNPYIMAHEIESARRRLPLKMFEQEYLARFITDAGEVFRNVMACATAIEQPGPIPGHRYFMSVDLAKQEDFSCYNIIDGTMRAQAYVERDQSPDYKIQVGRIAALYAIWRPEILVVESNAMGQSVIDMITGYGIPVHSLYMTNPLKQQLVQDAVFAFDTKSVQILNIPDQIQEFQSYAMRVSRETGLIRYGAPGRRNDDYVSSFIIGWHETINQGAVEAGYMRIWQ